MPYFSSNNPIQDLGRKTAKLPPNLQIFLRMGIIQFTLFLIKCLFALKKDLSREYAFWYTFEQIYTKSNGAVSRLRKLLTSHIKYMLENPKELQTGKYTKPQTRGKFFSDRRKDAEECIEYLTRLAKHLPEKQRERVFTREKLEPLIHTVLTSYEERQGELGNPRIFRIAQLLMKEGEDAAWKLLPSREVTLLMSNEGGFNKSRIIHTLSQFISFDQDRQKRKRKVLSHG